MEKVNMFNYTLSQRISKAYSASKEATETYRTQ